MRYCITYFDAEYTKQPSTFNISRSVLLLLSTLLFIMAIGVSFSAYLRICIPARTDIITHTVRVPEYSVDFNELAGITSHLSQIIDFLGKNESFISASFSNRIVSENFNYIEFVEKMSRAVEFAELLSAQSGNLEELKRLNDLLEQEVTLRQSKCNELLVYLEEQSVIWAHTPSIWPTPIQRLTSKFGFRRSPITGSPSFHEGVDLVAQTGTPVRATANGVVVFAGFRTGYGYLVTIDHGFGYITRYAHNSKLLVDTENIVKKGDLIAVSGSTGQSVGPHLHYEVLYNGVPVNASKFLP
jgi:murein DD-endopeptidase MepM/ murein hydrolase activator NlpD